MPSVKRTIIVSTLLALILFAGTQIVCAQESPMSSQKAGNASLQTYPPGYRQQFVPTGDGFLLKAAPKYVGSFRPASERMATASQFPPPTDNDGPANADSMFASTDMVQQIPDLPSGLAETVGNETGIAHSASPQYYPIPHQHDMATGGFFAGFGDLYGNSSTFLRNSGGGRGSGGGGSTSGSGPGITAVQNPGFGSNMPGMNVFMPACCSSKLPCCALSLKCCSQNQDQNKHHGSSGNLASTINSEAGGDIATGSTMAMAGALAGAFGLDLMNAAGGTMHQSKSNASQKEGSAASAIGEGALEAMSNTFPMMMNGLINVGNESSGHQTASGAVSKTYTNAVWMVQQMYRSVYLQIAILLVLPGAILTQMKSMVSFSFLNLRDEDTLSPFAGIQRAIIAIFLIPATQLIVSYMIDTGNALSGAVASHVDLGGIQIWARQQIQTFDTNQAGKMFENMPIVPRAPWRGKAAGMPNQLAVMEWMSYCDIAMCEAINQAAMVMCVATVIFNVLQIVLMCYLYLIGPITAAFFAWPGVGRELFRKAFSSWLDGVVVLALWKFWWDIVLLCWSVWLNNGHGNPFELVNGYYCIAWLALLLFVPFNPFDFKVGEIVSSILVRAEGAAAAGARKGAQEYQKRGGGGGSG